MSTQTKKMHKLIFTVEVIKEAIENQQGFCLSCGTVHDYIEPDARGYKCDECEADKVFGAEEIILMGRVF